MNRFPWSQLGIDRTGDTGAIRRAYAERLKALDLDEDMEAYADLRDARDLALAEARRTQAAPALLDEPAPDLDGEDWPSEPGEDDDLEWSIDEAMLADWDRPDDARLESYADERPDAPEIVAANAEVEALHRRAREAWDRIAGLLFPGDEPCEEGFDASEWQTAQAAFTDLIAAIEAMPLQDHGAIEIALADLLARGWPRSAPLVSMAEEHFDWLAQEGTIGEHPALQFLNARIRGMRFHEAVQDRSHPYHRAWNELANPRLPRWVSQFGIRQRKVMDLIGTVRGHFPELEHYFDGPRTLSWEEADGALIAAIIRIVIGVYLLFIVLGGIFGNGEADAPPVTAPPVVSASGGAGSGATASDERTMALRAAWREIFDEAYDPEIARRDAPWFTDIFAALVSAAPVTAAEPDAPQDAALGLVRSIMNSAVDTAAFDDLVRLQQVRLDWLRAARAQGGAEACGLVLDGHVRNAGFVLTQDQREAERAVAARLLHAGKLVEPLGRPANSFPIPGWLVEDMMKTSGLSSEAIAAAMRSPDDPRRCDVVIALLDAMVRNPAKTPAQTLRFY